MFAEASDFRKSWRLPLRSNRTLFSRTCSTERPIDDQFLDQLTNSILRRRNLGVTLFGEHDPLHPVHLGGRTRKAATRQIGPDPVEVPLVDQLATVAEQVGAAFDLRFALFVGSVGHLRLDFRGQSARLPADAQDRGLERSLQCFLADGDLPEIDNVLGEADIEAGAESLRLRGRIVEGKVNWNYIVTMDGSDFIAFTKVAGDPRVVQHLAREKGLRLLVGLIGPMLRFAGVLLLSLLAPRELPCYEPRKGEPQKLPVYQSQPDQSEGLTQPT